jgi:hypothetical protein
MSCVKEEMGCLTGWVAVMFLTSMAEEIARKEPSRCSSLMDSNSHHKFTMLARQSVFPVKLL